MSPFVKICGLAREEDVRRTALASPDAMGFVFWPRSPRAVSAEKVARWGKQIPPGILKVGVFVNQGLDEVRAIFDQAGLDIAQLHGVEDAAYIHALDRPVWKAFRLSQADADAMSDLPVRALVVDSGTPEMPGGTGIAVDWELAARFVARCPLPVLLAGGLRPSNVQHALATVKPWGVDVSSGVERRPGEKDMDRVRGFLLAARGEEPDPR